MQPYKIGSIKNKCVRERYISIASINTRHLLNTINKFGQLKNNNGNNNGGYVSD